MIAQGRTGEIAQHLSRGSDQAQQDYYADISHITKPFTDTGKTLEPSNPSSWTFPTKENYLGWMPGDPINPLTWATDSSLYIQEVMKQNFVIGPDGKRVSIFELKDDAFKYHFGNAARHALGLGDLVFNEGMKPQDAENGMWWHELSGWANSLLKSALSLSTEPFKSEMADSDADIKNNHFGAKECAKFQGYEAFARQMLSHSWKAATKNSWVLQDGAK